MVTNRLGMHWIRNHPDNDKDLEFVRRIQPASIKLFGGAWDDAGFCEVLKRVLPADCIILARDHPLSEQKEDMWRDPVGTGQRHADEWIDKVNTGRYHMPVDRTYFLGINEPDATSGNRHSIDLYTVAFLDRLRSHALKGGAFNFSTGHPCTVDGTANTPPDYAFFEESHKAIVRGGHIAIQHIYGSAEQPCVPGHFDRLKACPWQDVTWVIGECGIDQHVTTSGEHVGYLGALNPPSAYPQWMERLIRGTSDDRIHSWEIFTWDFSHPWSTFDARETNDAFLTWGWQGWEAAIPLDAPVTVHLPIVGGTVSQEDLFPKVIEWVLKWEGGYTDNPEDHGNWTGGRKGQGELKGTNFGISAASYPNLDIKNLTRDDAIAIYRRDYWGPSGAAEAKDYPTALLLMDSGVLHGVGAPQAWVKEYGLNPFAIAARRLRVYVNSDNWHYFGNAWTRRTADLLEEMGK